MRRFRQTTMLAALAAASTLAAPAVAIAAAPPSPAAAVAGEWPRHGLDAAETRFSPLSAIDTANVARLGLAWHFRFDRPRGVEATPIMVDGTLFVTGPWGVVYALDARSGRLKWQHDPEVPAGKGMHACCDVVNRGVAVEDGRVFVATIDGRLQALDAQDGRLLWSTGTFDIAAPYTITGAPRVARGLVVIGNGGAEYGVRGFVSAYDARTGALRWRFYTVPGNPADGADGAASDRPLETLARPTWTGEWWRHGGGGTVWDSMAWDPELDLLYFGVGNGSPHDRDLRSPDGGDNLFLSSIVAVRRATGEYVWHYQTTPGDSWDYTATQHMILADLAVDGRTRKVLMQAPKNGFFYVLDRATGELLSADKYVAVNWASHVDPESGRPVETAGARYPAGQPFLVQPSQLGGHNWQPMVWSPETGLVYVPAQENTGFMMKEPAFRHEPERWNTGVLNPPMPPDPALLPRTGAPVPGGLFVWKLDGKAAMPEPSARPRVAPPPDTGTEAEVARGATRYARYCMQCHGAGAVAGGGMPDLRHSPYLSEAALFRRPLLDGLLAARGMPGFAQTLTTADADAIRHYIIRMAQTLAHLPADE